MSYEFRNDYKYDYPEGLNLKPGSELHKRLLDALNDRIRRGYQTSHNQRQKWQKLDHLQGAYVPETNASILEIDRDAKSPVNVVIPVSRANLDVMVSYSAGVMLGDPTGMYALQALGDKERMVKAAKMDRLMNVQSSWFQHKLSHITALRDTFLYGLSCRMPVWAKHTRKEVVMEEVSEILRELIDPSIKANIGDMVRYLEERVYHEGCEIENIDVYSLIIDPYVKLNKYSQAEFMGFLSRTHAMSLLRRESDPEFRMFNCKYVHDLSKSGNARTKIQWLQEAGRNDASGISGETYVPGHPEMDTTTEADVAYLFWQLIPQEWGLGDSDKPELYAFAVAGDEVIIQCHSIDYDHGMYPMIFDGPQTTGYEMMPVSSLSATYGMHQFIDWKVRVHYWNASKVQNDQFVIDGSAINVKDFMRGGPGKLIRLLRPLYGNETIDKFIKQLSVQEVTNDYMNHVRGMMDCNDIVLGTHAITSGDMSGMPERPTQWGLQTAASNAVSRLQKDCEVITEQAWYTLIRQLAHNNVQFMENDVIVSIIGSRYEQQLREEFGATNEVSISPYDLDIGTFEVMPLSRMQKETDMQIMSQIMDRMLSVPEVAMDVFGGLDVQRMFLNLVRRSGFANIHEFRKEGGALPAINAQVMPDEQVIAQQQAGNLVPAQAVGL